MKEINYELRLKELNRRLAQLSQNIRNSIRTKLIKYKQSTLMKYNKKTLIKSLLFYQLIWKENSNSLLQCRFELRNIYQEMRKLMQENILLHECKNKKKVLRKLRRIKY